MALQSTSTSKILKRRSANYTQSEVECLLNIMESDPELAVNKTSGKYKDFHDLNEAWEKVAESITLVGSFSGVKRSAQDVKRKWTDLKSRVKAKAANIALQNERPGECPKLNNMERRVLGIMNLGYPKWDIDQNEYKESTPLIKIFSFQNESNSEAAHKEHSEDDEADTSKSELDATELLGIKCVDNELKKRRISEAFSSNNDQSLHIKKNKMTKEDQQIDEMCKAQLEINLELKNIKSILKKCHHSIEKLAVLKKAELRLKCAKYGVEFEDLFD